MKNLDKKNLNKEDERKLMFDFFHQRDVVGIATVNENNEPWLSNFYYVIGEDFKVYYFTVRDTLHTKNIAKNNKVSFSTFWHSRKTFLDRKSVQGTGIVRKATAEEKKIALNLSSDRFVEIQKNISEKVFLGEDSSITFWVLEPDFIKYLDDERYRDLESVNFKIVYDEKKVSLERQIS